MENIEAGEHPLRRTPSTDGQSEGTRTNATTAWSFPDELGARWSAYYAPEPCGWLPDAPSVETFVVEEMRFTARSNEATDGTEAAASASQGPPEPTAFTLVHIEKRNLTTTHATARLARAAGINARELSFAGQKDKASRARQWICVPTGAWERLAATLPGGVGPLDADLDILEVLPVRKRLKLGQLVGNLVSQTTQGSTHSRLAAGVAKYAILFLGIGMTLDQLGVGTQIVTLAVGAVLGGTALALGLAFGLGGKEKAKEMIEKSGA